MAGIPQVITEDRASGAQVIDGSLKFDKDRATYLKRDFSYPGDVRQWTWSAWIKRTHFDGAANFYRIFGSHQTSHFYFYEDDLYFDIGGSSQRLVTNQKFRDGGWFHLVVTLQTENRTSSDRMRIYVNGERVTSFSTSSYPADDNFGNPFIGGRINREDDHTIGYRIASQGDVGGAWSANISQVYFINAQALGPEYFGFTDPLTNTWRPKKFGYFNSAISTQYSGASALTWDDNPIGSVYTLSNGNRTATASGGGSGYTGADVWSNAIPANSTTAWTLDVTNSDNVGGWYFTDSQTASGTHPDERGGNSLGMRGQDLDAGWYGTFATVNGGSNGSHILDLLGTESWGSRRVDFVVYRPASGTGKVWVKNNGATAWVGGGNPSDTSSTASFLIPDGNTYFGYTFYDRSTYGDQIATLDGDGSIEQKISGATSFYLPMDGNSPIGKDQSGNGNDWTPVNFNCTVPLNKATGAIPILQTDGSGGTAVPGRDGNTVRTLRSSDKIVTASGGKYYIDGVETPTLNLIRGAYYIFDYSPGASSHPFKFSTTPDGTHNGGAAWTDGIQEDTNSGYERTRFFVPHTAPDTMYYYCSSHSGMGSQVNVTTDVFKSDPYAWKNILAIPYFRLDESHSVNEYESRHSVSEAGDPTIENIGNFYNSSFALDGTGDYVYINDSSEFSMGTDDFTLEMWIYPKSTHNGKLVFAHTSGSSYGWANLYFSNGVLELYSSSNGSSWISGLGPLVIGTPKLNEWSHVAVTRSGNTFRVFHNGVLTGTATSSASLMNSTGQLQIGARNGTDNFTGNFQDLRIYKGVAKYTEDFTVGSTNPDVLLDTPSGVSYKTKLDEIEQGSVSFNGTSDYLVIPASEDFNFEENDWTIEMYVYFEDFNQEMALIDWSNNGASTGSPAGRLFLDHDQYGGYLQWYKDSTVVGVAYRTAVKEREWTHISWHRDAPEQSGQQNAMRIVANGKHVGGTSQGTNNVYGTSAGDLWIGRDTAGNYFRGKISNLRITKGTVVYPDTASGFVDGPQPLTPLANTKLLCCKSSTVASAAEVAPGTFVNNGTNYSSGGQVTGSSGLSFVDSLFDGGLRASGASAGDAATVSASSDNYILWTPTTGIPYTSKVEVYCYAANGYEITNYYTFNGGSETTFTGGSSNFNGNNWITVATGSGTINSIKLRITRGSGQSTSVHWYAVRVDGTVLINNYIGKAIARFGTGAGTFNPFVGDDINVLQGQETGYATLNPLANAKFQSKTLKDGNLELSGNMSGGSGYPTAFSNFTMKGKGKWYMEATPFNTTDTNGVYIGVCNDQMTNLSVTVANTYPGGPGGVAYAANGTIADNGSNTFSSQPTYSAGDVISVAYDADIGNVYFAKNGSYLNGANPITGANPHDTGRTGDQFFVVGAYENRNVRVNFGQKPFKFPPPDGFQPLNLSNTQPEKVIVRPDQYVGVSLWSGNGTSQTITGLEHKPDLVWLKKRSGGTARSHQLFDSVRGVHKSLHSDSNNGEDTNTGRLTAFNRNGFAVGGDDGSNGSGGEFVAWTWKAGGSKGTFNVDDVGYANASDVNMNVGGLNSSSYNTDQIWSGLFTVAAGTFDQAVSLAFNGNIQAGSNRLRTSDNYVVITMSLSTPVNVSSQIKVYGGYDSTCTVTVGGNTYTSSTGVIHTFNVSGSLTQMTHRGNSTSGRTYMEGMEIDGKQLVDSNQTPPNSPSVANTGCSVGTKQGFSIVAYNATGSDLTVNHGLSERPGFIILKSKNVSGDWLVWHQNLAGVDRFMKLNETQAQAQASNVFLSVDSNTFGTGNDAGINSSNQQKIAYIWHDVPGLQKFGTYTGSGSGDGPFVELGFQPAIIWMKDITNGSNRHWCVVDSTRSTFNKGASAEVLFFDSNQIESRPDDGFGQFGSKPCVDILSNGFKLRESNTSGVWTQVNNTHTYIYCAWAEAPSINLYGAQSNAR